MNSGELWAGCNLLIDDRVVLHRTGAERVETVVHAEVVVAQIGIVTHNCQFVAFRQFGLFLTAQSLGQVCC